MHALLKKELWFYIYLRQEGQNIVFFFFFLFTFSFWSQVIIGIGAKPAVSPFERVGLNTDVGGIQVRPMNNNNLTKILKD